MLELKNIRKAYTVGSFTQVALDDVSISFRDSEFVAILGPSGSGKTTMLNLIGGLDHYDSGDLIIDSVSTHEYKDRDWDTYRNNRIGFVFQSYNLIPHQSVLKNVELALTLSGVDAETRRQRAIDALTEVGLKDHIDKRPSQLSGGQMQRVAIARALINDPEILLADEPTGALDSKTSVQIMDLLTKIADDRLVIMVTHNPELAQQYANRIVDLRDGKILSDTNPFTPEYQKVSKKQIRHTSMSFRTALGLSFNNLMTKKGRTLMTAIAGSIGIIGIAAILALANGVNNYIASVEEETLSEYPLQITSSGFSMDYLSESGGSSDDDADDESSDSKKVVNTSADGKVTKIGVNRIMTGMLSSITSNDLSSLKSYFDSGTSTIEKYTNAVEYSYNVTPQIFRVTEEYGYHQVNPDTSFSAFGLGSGSSNSLMSSLYSTDTFYQMPSDESLYKNQYDVLAGHWPENENECVLVLTKTGRITDFMLYTLGMRDSKEISTMITQFMNEKDVEAPEIQTTYEFNDILGITFKVVNSCDYYEYDSTYGVWVDRSDDKDYLESLVDKGENLTIVGVVKPGENQKISMLSSGINYPSSLTYSMIDAASKSAVVQDQLANKDKDVITGKNFVDEESSTSSNLDMSSLFSIDTDALTSAFQMDTSALSIDENALMNAVASANLPSFPQPDPSAFADLGITLDDTTSQALANATALLMMNYIVYESPASTVDMATGFAAWACDPDNPDMVRTDPTNPETSTGINPNLFLQYTVAQATGISNLSDNLSAALQKYLTSAVTQYTQELVQVVTVTVATEVATQMGTGLSSAMSIDTSAFANAFQFNLDSSQLTSIMSSMSSKETHSYAGNLSLMGYANLDEPSEIDIYPKSFEDKEQVVNILEDYNDRMKAAGEEGKVISYTDLVGTLMSSVTDIVNMISMVLIAFVAISLIVSSIMIGVITFISVLERKKEIGILRAIGASKRDISRVFNAETVIEGLASGIIGVGFTALACIPANIIVEAVTDVPNVANLPVMAGIVLILISVFLTFIAGLIPSSRAANSDPVEALRSE